LPIICCLRHFLFVLSYKHQLKGTIEVDEHKYKVSIIQTTKTLRKGFLYLQNVLNEIVLLGDSGRSKFTDPTVGIARSRSVPNLLQDLVHIVKYSAAYK
jgi:hypothetical protein